MPPPLKLSALLDINYECVSCHIECKLVNPVSLQTSSASLFLQVLAVPFIAWTDASSPLEDSQRLTLEISYVCPISTAFLSVRLSPSSRHFLRTLSCKQRNTIASWTRRSASKCPQFLTRIFRSVTKLSNVSATVCFLLSNFKLALIRFFHGAGYSSNFSMLGANLCVLADAMAKSLWISQPRFPT